MNVIALTVFVGFVLVLFFITLFLSQACGNHPPTERDALMPLENDHPSAPER